MSDVPLTFKFIDECRMTPAFICLSKLALHDEARSSQSVHSVLHTIFVLPVLRIFHPRHSCIAHVDFHNNHNKFSFSM